MEGKPVLSLSFWREGYAFLFGRNGIIREVTGDFRLFYRDDIHPCLIDNRDLPRK